MDLSATIKIKKELDDPPEDNPDLVDVGEMERLAGDDPGIVSYNPLPVKTELKEENEVYAANNVTEEGAGRETTRNKLKSKKPPNRTKVKCEQCGVMCRDKNGYKLHLMDHTGERPFKCSLCEKTYKKAMDLTYHMISHTGNHDHHCETCGKGFAVRSALRAHARTHTKDKPYVCPICGRGFSHSSSLKPHIAIHSDECPFECDRCDRKFKTKKTLTHHAQTHDLDEGKGLQCGICFKFYKSKESIRIHLKIHRQGDGQGGPDQRQTHSCERCGNTYKHLISLRNHMRYHTNDMFECHMCDKAYVDKNHLRIHLRNHTGETPYTCEVCNRKFRRRDSFVYHKTTHESNRKTFKCDLCDKVLVCKSSLRAHHTLIHSTEKKHQCGLCKQRFKMRYELTKHTRRHRENGELFEDDRAELVEVVPDVARGLGEAVCEVCEKDCGEEGLEVHMASHDVKPVKCECAKLFYSGRDYKRHVGGECETMEKNLGWRGQGRAQDEGLYKREAGVSVKKESNV